MALLAAADGLSSTLRTVPDWVLVVFVLSLLLASTSIRDGVTISQGWKLLGAALVIGAFSSVLFMTDKLVAVALMLSFTVYAVIAFARFVLRHRAVSHLP